MNNRLIKLIRNPKNEYQKVVPYLSTTFKQLIRWICEFFRYDKFSKVYEGHDDLLKHLGKMKDGFFIECGANNGFRSDPTYYLEKILGWKGILVEPLPAAYEVCKQFRKKSTIFNCALVSHDYKDETIKLIDCKLMTIVKGVDGYEEWVKDGENVQKYIMIGNETVHYLKPILEKPHKEFKFPWLYSRSLRHSSNVIYLWEN